MDVAESMNGLWMWVGMDLRCGQTLFYVFSFISLPIEKHQQQNKKRTSRHLSVCAAFPGVNGLFTAGKDLHGRERQEKDGGRKKMGEGGGRRGGERWVGAWRGGGGGEEKDGAGRG